MGITPFPADDEKLTIDSDELQKATLGRWSDAHLWMRKEAESADLYHPIDLTLAEHRARNLEQLKLLTERNLISKAFPKRSVAKTITVATWLGSPNSSTHTPRCRLKPVCSGDCSEPPSCTWAPKNTTKSGLKT